MYSKSAVNYLLKKNSLRKQRFVIKTKVILASYATLIGYVAIRYFFNEIAHVVKVMAHIEPIIYVAFIALIFSVYTMTTKGGK